MFQFVKNDKKKQTKDQKQLEQWVFQTTNALGLSFDHYKPAEEYFFPSFPRQVGARPEVDWLVVEPSHLKNMLVKLQIGMQMNKK